jgi:hypothetical protein
MKIKFEDKTYEVRRGVPLMKCGFDNSADPNKVEEAFRKYFYNRD